MQSSVCQVCKNWCSSACMPHAATRNDAHRLHERFPQHKLTAEFQVQAACHMAACSPLYACMHRCGHGCCDESAFVRQVQHCALGCTLRNVRAQYFPAITVSGSIRSAFAHVSKFDFNAICHTATLPIAVCYSMQYSALAVLNAGSVCVGKAYLL